MDFKYTSTEPHDIPQYRMTYTDITKEMVYHNIKHTSDEFGIVDADNTNVLFRHPQFKHMGALKDINRRARAAMRAIKEYNKDRTALRARLDPNLILNVFKSQFADDPNAVSWVITKRLVSHRAHWPFRKISITKKRDGR